MPLQRLGYFLRWQLAPVVTALPGHVAFVLRGFAKGPVAVARRAAIATRCAWIHLRVVCAHNPLELLRVVEEVLDVPASVPGAVVECGAFTGGSTAKLSIAASLTGRRLIVCDSFEGLPSTGQDDNVEASKKGFAAGEYASTLDVLRRNVARFGKPDVVTCVPGWFDQSLPSLRGTPIACAYWDVDLADSFRSCIRHLWPGLAPGGKAFIHDIDRQAVVNVFTDERWWQETMGAEPPTLVGARKGLSRGARLLGYAIKT